ncbi:MAG: LLM class flavin-dependent oxidoreductase [Rhodoferax sp.]|nr:LLM class flavin-dependent oxidoreductase [Rhodoferax sp.]
MIPLSVLDLCPIVQGGDAARSFRNSLALARHAEQLGFRRYWLAEHHGMPGIASAATAVLMAHVAAGTQTIRIGAGGIMLPNHAPMVIAEQFGTLAALHPGRIDLGLGRAPGSDPATARALRRHLDTDAERFPDDVVELMDLLSDQPRSPVRAVPGQGARVPVWILGSSLFGAQLAALLGLPFAFASHFAPQMMLQAVALYRQHFRPSAQQDKPHVMLGFNVFAATSDEQAEWLASSMQQSFVNLRSGRPGPLPPPVAGYRQRLDGPLGAMLESVLAHSAIGSPATVLARMQAFVDLTQADELMITSQIFDHTARLASYGIVAGLQGQLKAASASQHRSLAA